ncbi:hypothetical protein JCM24511_01903 [Saitozyma sp. JCM 24511]|nr:hypothetical protein JCM24511_01903 [Saitozyma sp. JCM 24511]
MGKEMGREVATGSRSGFVYVYVYRQTGASLSDHNTAVRNGSSARTWRRPGARSPSTQTRAPSPEPGVRGNDVTTRRGWEEISIQSACYHGFTQQTCTEARRGATGRGGAG